MCENVKGSTTLTTLLPPTTYLFLIFETIPIPFAVTDQAGYEHSDRVRPVRRAPLIQQYDRHARVRGNQSGC